MFSILLPYETFYDAAVSKMIAHLSLVEEHYSDENFEEELRRRDPTC